MQFRRIEAAPSSIAIGEATRRNYLTVLLPKGVHERIKVVYVRSRDLDDRNSSLNPVALIFSRPGRIGDGFVGFRSDQSRRSYGRLTALGFSSAVRVAVWRYSFGSTPASLADSSRL